MASYLNFIIMKLIVSVAEAIFLRDALYYSGLACKNSNFKEVAGFYPPCSCTEDCRRYGDCCRDSEYFHSEEQIWGASRFSCSYLSYGTYYVMASCPADWKDEDTLQNCLSPDLSYRDPMLDVPVTSYRSNITYTNGYCAICNEDFDPSTDYIWNILFTCPTYSYDLGDINSGGFNNDFAFGNNNFSFGNFNNNFSFESFNTNFSLRSFNNNFNFGNINNNFSFGSFNNNVNFGSINNNLNFGNFNNNFSNQYPSFDNNDNYNENNFNDSFFSSSNWTNYDFYINSIKVVPNISDLFYNNSQSSWYWNKTDGIHKCYVSVSIPTQAWLFLKSCEKSLIGTCSADWTDSVVLEKCLSYTDVWCQLYKLYRNPYCAYCNFEEDISEYSGKNYCFRPSAHGVGGYSSDFSVLLDWSSLDNYRQCYSDEKYDPLKKECRSSSINRDDSGLGLDSLTLVFLCISILFLVLHLIVFIGTPRLMNMPAMNLASLCTSLLLLYSCFIANGFLEPPCTATAVAMHYSLLASFSWMFIISFDVWRAIRASTSNLRIMSGSKWRLFIVYSLVAWLSPAFLVGISLTLEITEIDLNFRPGYGEINCWISNKNSLLLFVVAPLLIVMILNLWFFSWTAWLIYSTRFETAKKSTSTTDFRLFVKLAVIMGLTWITGLIAGVAGFKAFWFLFIALNTLQGLFIFVSFSCTEKIWKELSRAKRISGTTTSRDQTTKTTQASVP